MIFIILFYSLNLFSQNSGSQYYTLDECFEIAGKKNPDIAIIQSRIDNTKANLTAAFGNYLPGLNFSTGFNTSNFQNVQLRTVFDNNGNVVIDPLTNLPKTERFTDFVKIQSYNMGLNLNYTIFDGFNREAIYAQSENNLNSQIQTGEQIIDEVSINIYRNYIQVIRNYQIVKIRTENVKVGKADLEIIQARYDAGAIPVVDIYTQEAELARRELQLVQAINDLEVSKANLLSVIGLNPTQTSDFAENSLPIEINENDILQFRKEYGSLESLIEISEENRDDLSALKYDIKSNEEQISMAQSSYWPRVSANAGWNWNNDNFSKFDENGRFTYGFSLQLPLFDRFSTNSNIENSRLQLNERKLQETKLKQNIKIAVKTSHLNLEATEKSILITKKALIASEMGLNSQKERYNLGAANINDYIRANEAFITSKIENINSIYSYILAQKELLFQIGNLKN